MSPKGDLPKDGLPKDGLPKGNLAEILPISIPLMIPTPGTFVQLASNPERTYQLLSIDEDSGSCWVRRWPLSTHGSPAFAVSLQQLILSELEAA